MKVTKSEYTKLAGDKTLKWHCFRADCKLSDPLSDISSKMSLLLNKFADLTTNDDLKVVTDSTLDLNSEVDKLTSKISELEPRLSAVEANISRVEADVRELQNQVGGVTQENEEELFAVMSERSHRLINVIIYKMSLKETRGIPMIRRVTT